MTIFSTLWATISSCVKCVISKTDMTIVFVKCLAQYLDVLNIQ